MEMDDNAKAFANRVPKDTIGAVSYTLWSWSNGDDDGTWFSHFLKMYTGRPYTGDDGYDDEPFPLDPV